MVRVACVLFAACLFIACGDDSPANSPTAPSASAVSSVTVSLQNDTMYLGLVQQATASTVPPGLAGTWASMNPAVASVDSSGGIRGVSSGSTEITYTVGATVGRAALRVVPEYAGTWVGSYSVTGCTDTGIFTRLDFCKNFNRTGLDVAMRATWTQSGTEVVGRIGIAPNWPDSEANTGRIEANGRMVFGATITLDDFTIRATWDLNSTERGIVVPASSLLEEWRLAGESGEGRVTASLRELRRQ
jgi:hypothetical protein